MRTMRRTGNCTPRFVACALVLAALGLWQPQEARAQWATNGNNINNTNPGNVGVGTAAPENTLHVHGGTVITTGALAGYGFRNRGSSSNVDDWVWYSASNVARFWRAGVGDLLGITTDGKLGVGTTSPNQKLSVVGTGAFYNSTPMQPSGVRGLFMGNFSVGSSIWSYDYVNGVGDPLHVSAKDINLNTYIGGNGVTRLHITNAGNVGIGTNTPGQKLSVFGGNVFQQWSATAGQEWGFYTSIRNNHVTSNLYFDGQWKMMTPGKGAFMSTSPLDEHAFSVYADNTSRAADSMASLSNLLMLRMNGNLGVGTINPAHKLDVVGNVNAAGLCIAGDCKTAWSQVGGGGTTSQWTTSGSNIFYSAGNVGIATTAPASAKLVIGGAAGAEGIDLATADQYANLRVIRNSNSVFDRDLFLQYGAGGGSKIHFYSDNTESMTLTAGRVGIGTATPTQSLDVVGNINVSGNINAKYQDVAEWVPSTQKLSAGTVVVLDPGESNHVVASASPYDTKVAGVVSGRPGIALGEQGEGKLLVATFGRVRVRVDATRAPIKVGDLLVTSDVSGAAMKSEPIAIGGRQMHAPGTIIGKALEPLAKGSGEILVLLSLQ